MMICPIVLGNQMHMIDIEIISGHFKIGRPPINRAVTVYIEV
jgi:hypothetical protein